MKKMSTSTDTKDIALTIYNGGFGAVKEKRAVQLEKEDRVLIFADVAQQIETDSLMVEGINVLEFNYDFDLVDRNKLLQKYVDKEVYLQDRETREKRSCRLLSAGEGGWVLEDLKTKEIYMDSQQEIILPSLPSGLIVKPALVWKTDGKTAESVKVSYLSRGFNWQANYVVELKETSLSLNGWAEIENRSGMTFDNARIKLIAGEVNRLEKEIRMDRMYVAEESGASYEPEVKPFFDYHMYTIKQPTTLKDNQSKQISIITGIDIPYKQYYKLGLYEEKADIIVEFQNRKEEGLGLAMPQGKIKLYKEDAADGSLEFIGEDGIEHTPKNEAVTLSIGKAFDIAFDYKKIDHQKKDGVEYYKYRCIIRNHKNTEAEVRFEHHRSGVWEMVNTTHPYEKISSNQIEFQVKVAAEEEVAVEFEYRMDWRQEVILKK